MEFVDYVKSLDPALLIALGAAVVMAALLLVVMIRSERSRTELTLRLTDMASAQQTAQGQLDQRLMDHERAIGKQMGDVTYRVGQNLNTTTEKTQKSLGLLQQRLEVIDRAQQNIAELSSNVLSLQEILSNKQSRGAFGNFQLEALVADALHPSNYKLEAMLSNNKRVDCLILLPNPPGPVPIDSKFPLESWKKIQEARLDDELKLARREFSTAIKTHVTAIKDRYLIPGETADCAIMFLPSESVYVELSTNFSNLIEDAWRNGVTIVSPPTLWPALVSMRAVFRDLRLREYSNALQKEVQEMLKDVGRLDERASDLQGHFEKTAEDIRKIRISTEKVTRRGERIKEIEYEEAAEPDERQTEVALIEGGRRG